MERAAPQDWYRIQRFADDVSLIDEPHIQAFYRCNIWHIRGRDQDMLVDSGMGVVSLIDKILNPLDCKERKAVSLPEPGPLT